MKRWLLITPLAAGLLVLPACDEQSSRKKSEGQWTPLAEEPATPPARQAVRSLIVQPTESGSEAASQLIMLDVAGEDALVKPVTPSASIRKALHFEPLDQSVPLGNRPERAPFAIPPRFAQKLIANRVEHPELQAQPALSTLNETDNSGHEPGRFLFRTHDLARGAAVTRTDVFTHETALVAQRPELSRLYGIHWSRRGTLLVAQASEAAHAPDADASAPKPMPRGYVVELDPFPDTTGIAPADNGKELTALGAMAHGGLAADREGNLFLTDLDERGSIYLFVPETPRDYSAGHLFVLAHPTGEAAHWVKLDSATAALDARQAAAAVGGGTFAFPRDPTYHTTRSGKQFLYVTVAGEKDQPGKVLSIELGDELIVRDFVTRKTIDASTLKPVGEALSQPYDLAIDPVGRLYIAEHGNPAERGDDIWVAADTDDDGVADVIGRFASLATFGAQPLGLYLDPFENHHLYVNVQHPTSLNDTVILIKPISDPVTPMMAAAKTYGGSGSAGFIPIAGFAKSGSSMGLLGGLGALNNTGDDDENDDNNNPNPPDNNTPPGDDPPGDDPPGDDPPGDNPPGDNPPGDDPPGDNPPGDDPPGDDPPGDDPPGDNPPGDDPPGDDPPGDDPPGDDPPGDDPPGDNPPGDNPPGDNPPGDNPPGDNPPGDNPPGDDPPGDDPPGDDPPPGGPGPGDDVNDDPPGENPPSNPPQNPPAAGHTPEPVTVALGLMSLGALSLAMGRRRWFTE